MKRNYSWLAWVLVVSKVEHDIVPRCCASEARVSCWLALTFLQHCPTLLAVGSRTRRAAANFTITLYFNGMAAMSIRKVETYDSVTSSSKKVTIKDFKALLVRRKDFKALLVRRKENVLHDIAAFSSYTWTWLSSRLSSVSFASSTSCIAVHSDSSIDSHTSIFRDLSSELDTEYFS
jgi:hypothetical protein